MSSRKLQFLSELANKITFGYLFSFRKFRKGGNLSDHAKFNLIYHFKSFMVKETKSLQS